MQFPTLFNSDEIDNHIYEQRTAPPPIEPDPRIVIDAKFPHIWKRIELMWGSVELHQYLTSLIMDDKHYETGVSRQGFPDDVANALLKVYRLHHDHMHSKLSYDDVWLNRK